MNRQQRRALKRNDRRQGAGGPIVRSAPAAPAAGLRAAEAALAAGEWQAAAALCRQALTRAPDDLDSHATLVRALGGFDRAAAIEHAEAALQRHPGEPRLRLALGNLLRADGRNDDALGVLGALVADAPTLAPAAFRYGQALYNADRDEEALVQYERAVALGLDAAPVWSAIGESLWDLQRWDEALAAFRSAAAKDGTDADLQAKVYFHHRHACDWAGFEAGRAAIDAACRPGAAGAISPFNVVACGLGPVAQRVNADNRVRRLGPPMPPVAARRPRLTGQLRIGYLSYDFRRHATALLMAQLFERHDRRRFEITAYSYGPKDHSGLRQRLIEGFDRFVDVADMSDAAAAQRIRDDGVDILVDTKGHANGARPGIVALRPAPVQVNYLVYPGTLGGDLADYIIGDPHITPFEHAPYYSEQIVQLPDTYQVNDTKREIAEPGPSRAECGLPDGAFVFCSFNDSYKVTPALFDVWMRLLRAVPDAVLWLLARSKTVETNLCREAAARGVEPSRLIFAPVIGVPNHLARQRHADLFLDSLEVNAHTTASEALWVGLPVLTCIGDAFAGRVAASLLRAAGLPELVTGSLQDYEALALRLARERDRLTGLRARLAAERLTMPLFDIDRSIHHLECAFERMWQRHLAGGPPEPFAVAALPAGAPVPARPSIGEVNRLSGQRFADAFAHHQAGRLEAAEAAYLAILAADPCHYDSLQHLAIVAAQSGDLERALWINDETLRTWPHQPPAHVTRSQIFHGLGRPEEAVTAARMALVLAPRDRAAQFQLGLMLRASGAADEAIDTFRAVLQDEPAFVEARYHLAELLREADRLDEALTVLAAAAGG